VTYEKVTHNCDNVDLAGASLVERLASDFGCGGSGLPELGGCSIVEGNLFAPPGSHCRDYYYLCQNADSFPDYFSCEEHLTQELYIDDCLVATKHIAFTITKDETGCRGTAQRN
jgi:hypothetical protein